MRSLWWILLLCSCSWITGPFAGEPCEPNAPPRCDGEYVVRCENGYERLETCTSGVCHPALNDCNAARCGDSVVDAGEACDDGNNNNADDCNTDCTVNLCGEGTGAAGASQDPQTGNCYLGFTGQQNWFVAEASCELLGGYLTVIESEEENLLARQALNIQTRTWIGFHDLDQEAGQDASGFQKVTGGTIGQGFQSFDSGEPSQSGNEDCVNFIFGELLWNDLPCTDTPSNGGFICELEPEPCGDGVLQPSVGELCDDGNNDNGDGCSAFCITEPACGNGILDAGEACEDGNNQSGDGCNELCQFEFCGDGVVNNSAALFPEQCDGGFSDMIGCSFSCELAYCGNGVIDLGEACDDGNLADEDGCEHDCTRPFCGNNLLDAFESCDDGNNVDGDGCSALCIDESPTNCGNSAIDAGELCAPGLPVLIPAGSIVTGMVIRDLNLDGLPDLALSNRGSPAPAGVRTIVQGPNRQFTETTPLFTSNFVFGLAAADFNFDGFPDLAFSHTANGTSQIDIFANNQEGSLSSTPNTGALIASLPTSLEADSIIAEDLDADGLPDLAVCDVNNGFTRLTLYFAARVLQGDETPTVLGINPNPPNNALIGGNAFALAAGDVNGDGLLDLLIVEQGTLVQFPSPAINLFLNGKDGVAGQFIEPAQRLPLDINDVAQQILLPDLDNDGDLDIVVRNEGRFGRSDNIFILRNDGLGNFTADSPLFLDGLGSMSIIDANHDGVLDLLVTREGALEIRLGPSFSAPALSVTTPCGLAGAADLDLDGVIDYAVVCGEAPANLALFFGTR